VDTLQLSDASVRPRSHFCPATTRIRARQGPARSG